VLLRAAWEEFAMSFRSRFSAVLALAGLVLASPLAGGCARPNAAPVASAKSAPEAALRMRSGQELRLADARGKVVVLAFFTTWCDACAEAIPALDASARDLEGGDVVVIAVNVDESRDAVDRFARRHHVDLPIALDDGALARKFDLPTIPTTVVLGRDGTVRSMHAGFHGRDEVAALEREIGDLRGEPAPVVEPAHAAPIPEAVAAATPSEPVTATVPCETTRSTDGEIDPMR
jgi:peroxiredoxin